MCPTSQKGRQGKSRSYEMDSVRPFFPGVWIRSCANKISERRGRIENAVLAKLCFVTLPDLMKIFDHLGRPAGPFIHRD